MSTETAIAVAVIGALGGSLTAIVAAVIAWLRHVSGRLSRLEHRDRLSWLYIRRLINHAYTHAPGVPLPDPPEGWLEETE